MDRKLLALSRTWCLYEVWAFVYYDDIRKVKICMPGESRAAVWVEKWGGGEVGGEGVSCGGGSVYCGGKHSRGAMCW